ncbi:MAG: type I-B CRISPR-associated protein Cas5b [Caldisericia bacterium]
MELIVFDLVGKMAHFRKYYTNSSSLTYYFPPRTTLIGLFAGIIGLKRDSYYKIFSKEKAFVSISIKSKIKKIIETVNYVWAEKGPELNLSKGQHTQIPLEILLPLDLNDLIRYRIYFTHIDEDIYKKVLESVKENKLLFPPYLGISEFLAKIEFVDIVKPEINKDKKVIINSVVNLDYIKNGKLIQKNGSVYVKERMPYDFNEERQLKEPPKDFIVEIKNGEVEVQLEEDLEYLLIDYKFGKENILFM